METIVLRIANNENEYARAVSEYHRKRGTYWTTTIMLGACIIAFFAYIFYKGLQDYWPSYLPILVTAVAIGANLYANSGRLKKQFRADPRNAKPFTWEASQQDLSVISQTTQVRYDWRNFRETMETEEFFFLTFTQNNNQFLFAPKRVFQSAQQMEQFRSLLLAKIG